jgi:hypothetical protein
MSEFEGPLKEDMVHTVDTSMSRKQLIAKQSKKNRTHKTVCSDGEMAF